MSTATSHTGYVLSTRTRDYYNVIQTDTEWILFIDVNIFKNCDFILKDQISDYDIFK